jgi:hypothetical protein
MRRLRRCGLTGRLSAGLLLAGLLSSPGLLLAIAAPTAGPAAAATGNQPGQTVASVVPSSATPGSRVTFAVTCASSDATSATLFGQTLGLPEQIPMEAGAADGDFVLTVSLPAGIRSGGYRVTIDCSDGTSTTARLTITAFPAAGGAQTGDGTTSTQTNTGLAAIGLGLTAVGAVCGGIALRRRSTGTRSLVRRSTCPVPQCAAA